MNVIRMVKLFGWEPKMNDKIAAKREAELVMQRKLKFLELANGCTKCVLRRYKYVKANKTLLAS